MMTPEVRRIYIAGETVFACKTRTLALRISPHMTMQSADVCIESLNGTYTLTKNRHGSRNVMAFSLDDILSFVEAEAEDNGHIINKLPRYIRLVDFDNLSDFTQYCAECRNAVK